MFRCEAVVGGEHERRELGGEPERAGVEVGHLEAADAETAAVEVHEHRKLLPALAAGGGGGGGPVHAEPEGARGVVDDVLPLHGQVRWHVTDEGEGG